MKQIPKIEFVNFQVVIVYIKLEIIARAGGASWCTKKESNFKDKDDLSINCNDVEYLCVERLFESKHNSLINLLYRPSNA